MCRAVADRSMEEMGRSISLKVVEKVADREGVDPVDLTPPLHTVVDTEALDSLFQSTSSTERAVGKVEFQYQGYQVQVDSSGEVQIGETVSFAERNGPGTQPTEDTLSD
nr:HalOD1 output domain-containing protein [Halopiger aswanensis]